jgi:hypothetical protein
MKRPGSIASVLLPLVLAAPALSAQAEQAQRIVVPLSEPDRPASVSCGLMYGSIEVKGGPGKEVVVVVRPEPADDEGERTEDGLRRIPNTAIGLEVEEQRNHVEVGGGYMNRSITLEITVPTKTSVSLSLVNGGEIAIENIDGEHEISNVNGGITATGVRGSVVANSTNGDIRVAFTGITPDKAMAFTTFNGDVDVTLPASTRANLKLNPGRGDIYTDFDVALEQAGAKVERGQGPAGYRVTLERDMQGRIGGGGPEMEFRTYNGDIYLRRAK